MSAKEPDSPYYRFRVCLRDLRTCHHTARDPGAAERMRLLGGSLEFRRIAALQNARALAVLCYAVVPLLLIDLIGYRFIADGAGPVAGTLVILYIPVGIWLGWRTGISTGIRKQRELQRKSELSMLFGRQGDAGTAERSGRDNDNN